uniref:SUEL-type lectin domain-containing protein n=1 Tax=Oryzias latipes TaxID=8090 RepID=A0A3B3I8T5_ORYLA
MTLELNSTTNTPLMNLHFTSQTKTCCKCVLTFFSWLSLISETENEVISVDSALYGRADRNTCSQGRPFWQLFNTGCSQSVTSFSFHRCELKQKCEVRMSDVRNPDPCWGTFKYLQTDFTCLAAEVDITCENDKAKLHCNWQVISVLSAFYGRRERNVCNDCPLAMSQNVNCENPTDVVAEECNGKKHCNIKAANSMFGDPCKGTRKYLEVTYVCICK